MPVKHPLMSPRYKAIAAYPNSQMFFEVGDIFQWNGFEYIIDRGPENTVGYSMETIESYPHLFRKMFWFEDRKADEMPEYVKYVNDKGEIESVKKPTKFMTTGGLAAFWDGTIETKGRFKGMEEPFPLGSYEPATEEEYKQFRG